MHIDEEQIVSDAIYQVSFLPKLYAELCEIKFLLQDIRDELFCHGDEKIEPPSGEAL